MYFSSSGATYYRIHHSLNKADAILSVETGYPQPLSNWQLPPEVRQVDAVFTWQQNFRSYFFSGTKYYRFDDAANSVSSNNKDISFMQIGQSKFKFLLSLSQKLY